MQRRDIAVGLLVRAAWGAQTAHVLSLGAVIACTLLLVGGVETGLGSIDRLRERAALALSGDASFVLWNGRAGVPLGVANELAALPGVTGVTSLDRARTGVPSVARDLFVVGIGSQGNQHLVDHELALGGVRLSDAALSRGIFLSATFLRRHQLQAGDVLALQLRGQRVEMAIAGTFRDSLLLDTFGESAALVDLARLTALRRAPIVERILVRLAADATTAEREAVRRVASGYGTLREKHFDSEYALGMASAARIGVRAALAWCLMLAGLACYGLAECVRADPRTLEVRSTLSSRPAWERAGLGAVALLITTGPFLVLGALAARVFANYLHRILLVPFGFFEGVGELSVPFDAHAWPGSVSWIAAFLTLSLLLSGREGRRDGRWTQRRAQRVVITIAIASALLVSTGLPGFEAAVSPVLGGYLAGGLVLVSVIGSISPYPQRLLAGLVGSLIPAQGAAVDLFSRTEPGFRTVLTVAAVSFFTLVTSAAVGVESVATSMQRWVSARLPGAVVVTHGNPYARLSEDLDPLAPEIVARVNEIAADAHVVETLTTSISFRGREVGVSARDYAALPALGSLAPTHRTDATLRDSLRAGGVAVSQRFSSQFGVGPGTKISLATHAGPRSFDVVGVVRDFSGPAGALLFDLTTFDRVWRRAGPSGLLLWGPGGSNRLSGRLQTHAALPDELHVETWEAYASYAGRAASGTGPLLRLLIPGLLGLLGVFLVAFVAIDFQAKRGAFALLLRLGATRSGAASAYCLELGCVLTLAAIAGVLLGVALAVPTLALLARVLGWTVQPALSLLPVLLVSCGVAGAGLLAWCALLSMSARAELESSLR